MRRDFVKSLKRTVTGLAARLVRRPRLSSAELLALRPRRILVVRQQNQMGDMVCATPGFRALRETYPDAEIALVTAPVNVEVVRHNPHLDRVFTFEQAMWRRPRRLLGLLREIRGFGPDLAFVLASVSFSVTSAGIALASGAKWVVGADSEPFGMNLSRHAFSLEMPSRVELTSNAVEHGLAPLRAIGIVTDNWATVVRPSAEEAAVAAGMAAELGLPAGFWAIHPGAGKKQNVWPAAGFAHVARRALEQGATVLLLHGPADQEAIAELVGLLGDDVGRGVLVAPPSPVGVGAALLNSADRFLCNDTGVMHVAGALGVPTVALFGPTNPALWKPPVASVVAVVSPGRSADERGPEYGWLENIDPEDVWSAWSGLPSRPANKAR